MKNCKELAPLLSAFFDGELAEDMCAEVRAHLEECEACRAKRAEYEAMSAGLAEAFAEAEVPAGFTESVMAAVRAEKAAAPKKAKKRAWRHLMPVAACAAIVLLAITLFPGMSKMSESTTADTAAPMMTENQMSISDAEASTVNEEENRGDMEFSADSYVLPHSSAYTAPSSDNRETLDKRIADGAERVAAQGTESNADDTLVYSCELREINGEEGLLWVEENGPVLLTIYGAEATEYVEESGGVEDGAGYYYLPISALYALPDGISLSDVQTAELAKAPEEAEWVIVCPDNYNEVLQS